MESEKIQKKEKLFMFVSMSVHTDAFFFFFFSPFFSAVDGLSFFLWWEKETENRQII